jgi:hypothetical protein
MDRYGRQYFPNVLPAILASDTFMRSIGALLDESRSTTGMVRRRIGLADLIRSPSVDPPRRGGKSVDGNIGRGGPLNVEILATPGDCTSRSHASRGDAVLFAQQRLRPDLRNSEVLAKSHDGSWRGALRDAAYGSPRPSLDQGAAFA